MKNKKTILLYLGAIIMCLFGGILFFNLQVEDNNSFYSKIENNNIRLTKEGIKVHISADIRYSKYCVKSTKTVPNKNNICWKDIEGDTVSIPTIDSEKNYLWLLDSNNNVSQTIEVNKYLTSSDIEDENYKITYNYNLFKAEKKAVNGLDIGYNEALQILTLNGTWENKSIALGKLLNVKLEDGEVYKLTLKYVGGSYTSKDNPKLVLDFQINNENYSPRAYEKTFTNGILPKVSYVERTIKVTKQILDTNGLYYWLSQDTENGTTFDNYRVQVFVTKEDTKDIKYNEPYGELKTIKKDGYKFLGWYESLSKEDKVDSDTIVSKNYNHTLYAHWEKE